MAEPCNFDDAVPLSMKYGERFNNWYMFKTFLRKQNLPLAYKDLDLNYLFTVWDYNYRFLMPDKFEFSRGTISYTNAERILGVFRFPRNAEGDFFTPLSMKEIQEKVKEGMNKLSQQEIDKLFELKSPVVFNAFKIPQYGFEYIDVSDFNLKEISDITDPEFVTTFKVKFDQIIEEKVEEVKKKILSIPNYLLILENTLDRQLRDLKEVSIMTNEIIHI
jgi:hypothetical protein